jgi:predicted ribosomally synthesized peptide with SipW-like signal peptide
MKKLLFFLMAPAACLGLLYTAFAYFEDTEASTDNTFQAGTWAVDVGGGGNNVSYTFQGLDPGASGRQSWTVTNTGSVDAFVDLDISIIEAGGLGGPLMAHLYISGGTDIYGAADSPQPLNGAGGSYDLNLPLAAGESRDFILDWNVINDYVPGDVDEVELTLHFNIQPAP